MYIDRYFRKYDIYIVRNLIPDNTCKEIVRAIESSEKTKDTGNAKYLNSYNVTDDSKFSKFEIDRYAAMTIQKMTDIPCHKMSRLIFRKVHGETKKHKDGCDVKIDDRLYRTMSLVYSFNDNKGGRFTFPRQGVSFKLNQGDIAIFPPFWTHPHMVSAPEPGTYRYTAVSWLYYDESHD